VAHFKRLLVAHFKRLSVAHFKRSMLAHCGRSLVVCCKRTLVAHFKAKTSDSFPLSSHFLNYSMNFLTIQPCNKMNNYLLHKIVHKIYIYIYDDDGNPGPDLGKTQKCMYIRHVPWIVTQEYNSM
jgi:hypothetical protein